MKIFEKLNINPIELSVLNDLDSHLINFNYINPNTMTLDMLKFGYIIKTRYNIYDVDKDNHYLLLDNKQLNKLAVLSNQDKNSEIGAVRPSQAKNNISLLLFKNYINWPKHDTYECFDIVGIWETNIDIRTINSSKNLKNIFDKYNIYDL